MLVLVFDRTIEGLLIICSRVQWVFFKHVGEMNGMYSNTLPVAYVSVVQFYSVLSYLLFCSEKPGKKKI